MSPLHPDIRNAFEQLPTMDTLERYRKGLMSYICISRVIARPRLEYSGITTAATHAILLGHHLLPPVRMQDSGA